MKNKTKIKLFFAFTLGILYFLYSFVLAPIYSRVCADVIYSEGALPYVLEFAMELCQLFIWCNLFSFVITTPSVFTYSYIFILTALRYFLLPVVTLTFYDGDALYLLGDALRYTLFDILQIAIVGICSAFVLRNKTIALKDLKAFGKIGRAFVPYRNMAIISSALLMSVRVAMRIVFDVSYGTPQNFREILYMILYYSFDLLYGFVGYLIIVLMLKMYRKKDLQ